jgi:flagellar motor switch protein FliG
MSEEKSGIFINGKKQVIELVQRMDSKDKAILLKNIQLKNPALARELSEASISFQSIWELDDKDLSILLGQVHAGIIGLSLSLCSQKNQRRALSLLGRDKAMQAFEVMQRDLYSHKNECLKAQIKIKDIAINLQRDRIIKFY